MIASIRFTDDYPSYVVSALNEMNGGAGNDDLTAIAQALGEDASDAENLVRGGSGDDTLYAEATALAGGLQAEANDARNLLFGGEGNDNLTGTISEGSPGSNLLSGGAGDDEISAMGGTDNRLSGGGGRDRLVGSAGSDSLRGGSSSDVLTAAGGDDTLEGGGGRDTFAVSLWEDEGTDTIVDFEAGADMLVFYGVDDTGASGLADDIDRMATIRDRGAGGDVVVTFDIGTEVVFAGRGTGSVNSIADLVDDPNSQILDQLLT